ncbi:MAG: M48 family metalloprotease [Deltaproteobacteria bacterium]|nr:M48 family metalloprotease [Deltaproteobacteria bacterium]
MFNNIIYFIIVLLVFNINYPKSSQLLSPVYSLGMIFPCWLIFLGYCRVSFHRFIKRTSGSGNYDGRLTGEYHNLIMKLSITAILLFCLDIYLFDIKSWMQIIPVVNQFSVLQGSIALIIFISYLATIWYCAHPAHSVIFKTKLSRKSFIRSNLHLNIPILFPWLALTLIYDLIAVSPWGGPYSLINRPVGQIFFFSFFLGLMVVFMPPFIQYWWGCEHFGKSEKLDELRKFLRDMRFRYRGLMRWPAFEGRMMTAGVMGVVPRFRYILVTDSLMELLSVEELKAVLAHEVGHIKYRHLLFYIFFFIGYMILALGLFDIPFYLIAAHPSFPGLAGTGTCKSPSLLYLFLSMPMLVLMIIYFRFIMGFFMRNFERQADLYSAEVMGRPWPIISSLEKIGLLSGRSREIPSWHHFSIKQRVDCLWRVSKDPGLIKRHNRFVISSFMIFLTCVIGLGYFLNFSKVKRDFEYSLVGKMLDVELDEDPDNIQLLQNLAMVNHNLERYEEAVYLYERILRIDDGHAVALNNLAWLLVTSKNPDLIDPQRAVELAAKAVEIEKNPMYIDTLAEAYYVKGDLVNAVETIKLALTMEPDNKYYQNQFNKYKKRDNR